MATFVKYFEAFSDTTKSSDDLVDALIKIEGYGDNSARTKVNTARKIFTQKMAVSALKYILKSEKADSWVIPKAKFLLVENT